MKSVRIKFPPGAVIAVLIIAVQTVYAVRPATKYWPFSNYAMFNRVAPSTATVDMFYGITGEQAEFLLDRCTTFGPIDMARLRGWIAGLPSLRDENLRRAFQYLLQLYNQGADQPASGKPHAVGSAALRCPSEKTMRSVAAANSFRASASRVRRV